MCIVSSMYCVSYTTQDWQLHVNNYVLPLLLGYNFYFKGHFVAKVQTLSQQNPNTNGVAVI